MKNLKILALLLAALLCLSACGSTQAEKDKASKTAAANNTKTEVAADAAAEDTASDDGSQEPVVNAEATPRPDSNIPDATTTEAPTPEGESYQTTGMYLGMADSNLMVIIEANPEDGQQEKSYQISPEIDLEAMGISEGTLVDLSYTVDENGIKIVKSVSIVVGE